MTGFSKILSSAKSSNLFKNSILFNKQNTSLLKNAGKTINNVNNQLITQVREGHARTMFIRPGKFYTKKFMDIMHFHLILAASPFLLLWSYLNMFQGPATLTEIPEGYEPRHWEYQRNPVKRFLAKNVYDPLEQQHERTLHYVYTESCAIKMRLLEKKVRNMMMEKQDYKGWYYVPVNKQKYEKKNEFVNISKEMGYKP